jgi:hypothetical protein
MSSRYTIDGKLTKGGLVTGLEGIDIPEDFELPSCGIEDVDRAMFKLFDKDIPMNYLLDGDIKKIPIIFGAGERAFLLRRKEPIRDTQGALILPMVSILRTGISQEAPAGIGPGHGEITIKKRLAPEDRAWKKLTNPQNLANIEGIDSQPGDSNTKIEIDPKSSVYEVITMPVPRFFNAEYEVTFWAQYQTQMNDMVEALISSYNIRPARTFRIESPKGYWFVATVEESLSFENNIDNYTDDERILKATINFKVTGYIVNPKFPGAPSDIRRYVSAPRVSFDVSDELPPNVGSSLLPSNNPDDYKFEDFAHENLAMPGSGVAQADSDGDQLNSSVGSTNLQSKSVKSEILANPFTNDPVRASLKTKNLSKGERVYIIIENLDK